MNKLILIAFLAVSPIALSACGTIHGMGQDMEAAGRGIQRTIN